MDPTADDIVSPADMVFMVMGGRMPALALRGLAPQTGPVAATASLAGRVFLDADGDGCYAEGDVAVAGVEVLITGRTADGRPVRGATKTRADGRYLFENLPPGSYVVGGPTGRPCVGTVDGRPAGQAGEGCVAHIVLPAGAVAEEYSFAEVRPASVSGLVLLEDDDDDGPGEEPFAGVHVILSGIDGLGRVVQQSATTDARGAYRIAGLHPGCYDLFAVPRKGYAATAARPGDKGGRPGGPGKVAGVALASGTHGSGYNFTATPQGVLLGRVTGGASGVRVLLTGVDEFGHPMTRTARTGPAGHYRFERLRPGTYRVAAGGAVLDGIVLAPGAASGGHDLTPAR